MKKRPLCFPKAARGSLDRMENKSAVEDQDQYSEKRAVMSAA